MERSYNSKDTASALKNSRFIQSDFSIFDKLSIEVHSLPIRTFTSLSVDEILLAKYMNCYSNFRGL